MHLAAHSGATTELLRKMLEASPKTARVSNKRGATPFFLIPRSYEYAECLEDIEEDGEYEDDWERVCMFLKVTYFGSLQVPKGRKFYSLHAAASVKCPRILLQTVAKLFPEQAVQRDENGLTPLAIAASASIFQEPEIEAADDFVDDQYYNHFTSPIDYSGPDHSEQENNLNHIFKVESLSSLGNQSYGHSREGSLISEQASDSNHGHASKTSLHPKSPQKLAVIDILVSLNPRAAKIPDSDGRLPFARAVESRKSWDEGLRSLLWAAPEALSTRDTKTGMYPFMIAAVEHNASETTVYELIRLLPELISIGIPQTADAQTTIDTNKSNDKLYNTDRKDDRITSFSKKRKFEHEPSLHLRNENKRTTPIMV